MIDPHVHCRDGIEARKATIAGTLELANEQGVGIIFDMPNTDPPIITEEDVNKRIELVPSDQVNRYFLYIGATAISKQLRGAVECYYRHPRIIGIKMFAGRSVGDLAIIGFDEQRNVYRVLADLGYEGVLAVHCEKESLMDSGVWDPTYPKTHSCARPKEAEIESVRDQIELARESLFKGNLHICHISTPEAVELVDGAWRAGDIRITCGATPHHLMLDWNEMIKVDGLLCKMNPPLRDRETVEGLRRCLTEGEIDWVETDHAPHQRKEKLGFPHLSGYPSLGLYRNFIEEFLPNLGLTDGQIEDLTYNNIIKVFGSKLNKAGLDI